MLLQVRSVQLCWVLVVVLIVIMNQSMTVDASSLRGGESNVTSSKATARKQYSVPPAIAAHFKPAKHTSYPYKLNSSTMAVAAHVQLTKNSKAIAQKRNSTGKAVAPRIKPTKNSSYIVCAMLKEEDLYVEEWIQYHMFLGFDTFELYDNYQNGSVVLPQLAQKYAPRIKLHNISGDGMQRYVYNLCTKQYANQSVFAAFIDCDEFIVLRNHTNIADFITDVAPNGESVSLNWIRFGSNGHTKYENAPVLSRFTNRSAIVSDYIKTISFLPGVEKANVHFPRMRRGYYRINAHGKRYQTDFQVGTEDMAAIHHYFTKSYDEFRLKRLRGYSQYPATAVKYHRSDGEAIMLGEFNQSEHYANAVRDTRALDFFLKHQHLQQQQQQREGTVPALVVV